MTILGMKTFGRFLIFHFYFIFNSIFKIKMQVPELSELVDALDGLIGIQLCDIVLIKLPCLPCQDIVLPMLAFLTQRLQPID